MQFRDLAYQYQQLKPEIDAALLNAAANAQYISGPQVKELEGVLAQYVNVKHCITCANGTDALTLALMAWGIGSGDAVFVPDFTFFASGECPALRGATPIFVDVDASTYNIDTEKLEEAILAILAEGKLIPKVVVAVDLFGLPADYEKISAICKKYGLLLLEDGAQGFGGAINGKLACSFGDISTTSFFPAKPLGCYGDGGAIFTDNDEWAELIRSYAVHGKGGNDKYNNVRIGLNSRLDTLQAAVLLPKFKAFKEYELDNVNKVAAWYTEYLSGCELVLPIIKDGFYSSWAQYTIQLPETADRGKIQAVLKEKGIPTMVYYAKPMHLQGAFADTCSKDASCPVTERLCKTVLSLPMHPYLSQEDARFICDCLIDLL